MRLTHVSIYSGVGGFEIAAHRAGFETVAMCDSDEYCRRVLARHFPGVPIYDNDETFPANEFRGASLLTAGFPCQPSSVCGYGRGVADARWRWPHTARIIRDVQPRYVVLENVPGLLRRGFGIVLADLAALGFDAIWDVLPASAFGAYHERERLIVLAYREGEHGVAHDLLETGEDGRASMQSRRLHSLALATRGQQIGARLECEPDVARLVHEVPQPVDELRTLGNAVMPDQVLPILEAIATALRTAPQHGLGWQPTSLVQEKGS